MSTKTAINYLAERIDWQRTADPFHPFTAKFEGEKCVIRLNDFPGEHLYTLIVDGEEVLAFDDWSPNWNRPTKEMAVSQTAPDKSLARTRRQRAPQSGLMEPSSNLSEREAEVLRLVARGYTNKKIAAYLSISVKTVETHKSNLMGKLDLKSRVEMVRYALRQGWLRET